MAKAHTPHVAILPSPGMGHLIPLVEFAKRLVHQHNFTVTFLIPTDGSPTKVQKSTLDSLPSSIDSVFLPSVDLSDLPEDTKIETMISLTVVRSLVFLRDALNSLVSKTKLVALVVDLFATDAFDVAREFNVSPYIFFPSTAMTLSLFLLHLPKLDQMVSCEYKDLPELVRIPGCIPIHGKDFPSFSSTPTSKHMANKHTIILLQTSQNRATRTFMDYNSINQAMDGICGLYERKLKQLNPAVRNITYDVVELYNFIDGLADMSALVYDHNIQAFLPYDRQWIKQKVFQHLKKLAH